MARVCFLLSEGGKGGKGVFMEDAGYFLLPCYVREEEKKGGSFSQVVRDCVIVLFMVD